MKHANLAIPAHGSLDLLSLGCAHRALVTAFPGDTTMATLEQARSLARAGSARIQDESKMNPR
jgi:hypothetical protein